MNRKSGINDGEAQNGELTLYKPERSDGVDGVNITEVESHRLAQEVAGRVAATSMGLTQNDGSGDVIDINRIEPIPGFKVSQGLKLSASDGKARLRRVFFEKFGEKDGGLEREIILNNKRLLVKVRCPAPDKGSHLYVSRPMRGRSEMPLYWFIPADGKPPRASESQSDLYGMYLAEFKFTNIYDLLCAALESIPS